MKPIQYFINIRGNRCENCNKEFTYNNPPQRHHCIEKKRKRFPELDNEINIELVCQECHTGKAILDSESHAIEFVKRQIARGYDVLSWYRDLSLKTRRFPNLKGMIKF